MLAKAAGLNRCKLFSVLVHGRAVIKCTSVLPPLNNSSLMHGRSRVRKTEAYGKRREHEERIETETSGT